MLKQLVLFYSPILWNDPYFSYTDWTTFDEAAATANNLFREGEIRCSKRVSIPHGPALDNIQLFQKGKHRQFGALHPFVPYVFSMPILVRSLECGNCFNLPTEVAVVV